MNHVVPMDCPYAFDNLLSKIADFGFTQELTSVHQRRQVLGNTEFLAKVHTVQVVDHAKVLDDVAMTS